MDNQGEDHGQRETSETQIMVGISLDGSMASHGLGETGGGLMLPLGKNLYQNIHNT
jgi:imidazoleglycerol phosphate dehydratase HisB